MKKGNLYSILFMVIITSFFTFILATVNTNTAHIIEGNQAVKNQQKILSAFNIPYDISSNIDDIKSIYDSHVEEEIVDGSIRYLGYKNEQFIGYGFIMEGAGLWGNIQGFIALDPNLEKILGIEFFSHSETPGLGGRIDETWYKDQFRSVSLMDSFPYITYVPDPSGQVEAISGATSTSNAVLAIINDQIEEYIVNVSEVNVDVKN